MINKHFQNISIITITIIAFNSCDTTEILTDAQKIAALRNVTIIYDNMSYEIGLPPGALSGKSLADLIFEDSSTYKNPENYSITIAANLIADNTAENAEDAKFDGLEVDIVMDTIKSNPIAMYADGFEVKKNTTYPVDMETTINLKTHRKTGLYIFRQTVDGEDLATTIYPLLLYSIGTQNGTINLPSIYEEIPTRASEETKEFLRQVLDAGIFDE
jgi:hypothetical protein